MMAEHKHTHHTKHEHDPADPPPEIVPDDATDAALPTDAPTPTADPVIGDHMYAPDATPGGPPPGHAGSTNPDDAPADISEEISGTKVEGEETTGTSGF